jgi:tRNA(His) 5'-end guanylyltransferase
MHLVIFIGIQRSGKGVNFNDLPNWQKRGSGLYWEDYD